MTMMKNDYEYDILDKLLKKYQKRLLKYGQTKNNRRIGLKITEIYRAYRETDADIGIKQQINEAAGALADRGYIFAEFLPYSDDIEKIYLSGNRAAEAESYMKRRYQIPARYDVLTDVCRLTEEYAGKGELTEYYGSRLRDSVERSLCDVDIERERDIFRMLAFIQDNDQDLYMREVSVLVYGESKYFEEKTCHAVCAVIREALAQPEEESGPDDDILRQFHISNVEQEISVKGDFAIEMDDYCLETRHFAGGVSLSSKDMERIRRITVRTENILTIENKTSYCRFEWEDCSEIYLGGYASRHQITFIKKVCADNPFCRLLHFGDIDIGGFLIHRHLCGASGADFELFHMGAEELADARYQGALRALTERDIMRAQKLAGKEPYKEALAEMLRRGVKLEQEIVSYWLMKEKARET